MHDALAAEGEGCLAALKAAMELGISRITIETDSANLVKAVMSNEYDRAPSGVIFKELRVLLSLHFVTLSFLHVPRTCYSCAHELAHVGFCRDPDQPAIWWAFLIRARAPGAVLAIDPTSSIITGCPAPLSAVRTFVRVSDSPVLFHHSNKKI